MKRVLVPMLGVESDQAALAAGADGRLRTESVESTDSN